MHFDSGTDVEQQWMSSSNHTPPPCVTRLEEVDVRSHLGRQGCMMLWIIVEAFAGVYSQIGLILVIAECDSGVGMANRS